MTSPCGKTGRVAGSISGFTEIDESGSSGGQDCADIKKPKVYDTSKIIDTIRELQNLLDPEDFLAVKNEMENHILARDNPHEVTIDDVSDDFIPDLFKRILPGIVPNSLPWFIFIPEMLKVITYTTQRNTPIYICSREGYLEEIPANTVAIDHSTGWSMLPSWGARTNTIPKSQPMNNTQSNTVNATLTAAGPNDVVSPLLDQQYGHITDTNTSGRHGYSFSVTYANEKDHVSSLFIFPRVTTGYLTLFIDGNEADQVRVDIEKESYVEIGNMKGYLHVLASGWWRIGIQYLPIGVSGGDIKILYHTDENTFEYTGGNDLLFSIFGLQHTEGIGLSPYIPTNNGPESHDATTYTLDPEEMPNNKEGIAVLNILRSQILDSSTAMEKGPIELGPNILLSQTETENKLVFFPTLPNEITHTLPHENIENMFIAVSYEPGGLKYATSEQQVTVDDTPLSDVGPLIPWVIHPIEGGIYSITTYPQGDTKNVLKFLLQEDMDVPINGN